MKNKVMLFGKVDAGGKLAFDSPADFARARAMFRGRDVQIVMSHRSKRRSDRQNAYYWGVVLPLLCEEFGYYSEQMHDALKCAFLREDDKKLGLAKIRSTASLDTAEFEEYMRTIREWASTQGVFIPEPNEELY